MSAYNELVDFMYAGETVEAIVFGEWGEYQAENEPAIPIPENKVGVILSFEEARPFMMDWSFYEDVNYLCYATRIWTNWRIIWVEYYNAENDNGPTYLNSVPRHPTGDIPILL